MLCLEGIKNETVDLKAMSAINPSMDDLPPNVMLDILSRLPVKTIIHCKCVCKRWQNIILDPYFADIHLSRSPAGLMIHHELTGGYQPGTLKWVEIEEESDYHYLHHDLLMSLDLNLATIFQHSRIRLVGSVNGLICLWQYGPKVHDNTYICNPITREYMILPRQQYYGDGYEIIVHGFGVGSEKNEYKVVRTFQGNIPPDPTSVSRPRLLEAEVYTLGTGQWRSLGHVPYLLNGFLGLGPFLNGHAHWSVLYPDSPEEICAFDFDNETFNLFPSPPIEFETILESHIHFRSLGVLKGCLSQSDTFETQITIWVMKEYGIKSSWHREAVIKQTISPDLDWVMWHPMHLLEGLKDGTILMICDRHTLLSYCPCRKTVEDRSIFDWYFTGLAYHPSFVKLLDFKSEKVHVF